MFDAAQSLFELQNWAGNVASSELMHVTPLSLGVLYGTGLLMAFSPCALSLLPLTVGYIAGTENESGVAESESDVAENESSVIDFDDVSRSSVTESSSGFGGGGAFLPSVSFAAGLATVLSALGLAATLAGRVFGSAGNGAGVLGSAALPLASASLATAMGLSLLGLLDVSLPSFEAGVEGFSGLPRSARAFVLGASSALVASPCCTPVLASILGFVAASRDPLLGLALLLAYSAGYTTPLVAAGTASGALSRVMQAGGLTWVTPASGAALISYGTYTGLSALFGA